VRRADLANTLEGVPVLTALNLKQQAEVEEVLKLPGLWHIYGLMLGSRQAQYAVLSHAALTNMETVSRAAVIQGTIRGIELFRDTLVELTVPDGGQKQEQSHG
jgi:hypothetical protein